MNYYLKKTEKSLDLVKNLLTFTNPAYEKAQRTNNTKARFIPKQITLYKIIGDKIEIPYGTFNYFTSLMGKKPKTIFPYITYEGTIPLYDYQEKAVDYMKRTTNCLLVSGTGSGKTQIGIGLIKALGLKTLWITHTQDLLDQSKNRFKQYLDNPIGEIAEGKVNIQDMTFALIQTLSRIDLELYKDMFDLVIIDEVQHCSTNITNTTMYEKVLNRLNASYRYGLTATLHRADGLEKAIEELISHDIYVVDESQVKKLKATIKTIPYDEEVKRIIAGQDIYTTNVLYTLPYLDADGTINYTKLINYLSTDEERTKFIVNLVNAYPERKIMVLAHRKSHCERLNTLIESSIYLSSNLSRKARMSVIDAFKENKYRVFIATYQLAREGLDLPNTDLLILATPVKDETIVIQSIGRVERFVEGKKEPIVLDIVDNKISYCLGLKKQRNKVLKRYGYLV